MKTSYQLRVASLQKRTLRKRFSANNCQLTTPNLSFGFTLIELLVVMSIMIVISSIILARYNQFNGTVLLRSLAYDVALTMREAQVYGLSGKGLSGSFITRYGVYYAKATPTQYLIFADANNNQAYDSGETVEAYSMLSGYAISNLCAYKADSTVRCSAAGDITVMTVMFKRPEPDAIITTDIAESYVRGTVTITSAAGLSRTVEVTNTGQLAVDQAN